MSENKRCSAKHGRPMEKKVRCLMLAGHSGGHIGEDEFGRHVAWLTPTPPKEESK